MALRPPPKPWAGSIPANGERKIVAGRDPIYAILVTSASSPTLLVGAFHDTNPEPSEHSSNSSLAPHLVQLQIADCVYWSERRGRAFPPMRRRRAGCLADR